jgi:phosphoribosyl-AMP cyclohydrolase
VISTDHLFLTGFPMAEPAPPPQVTQPLRPTHRLDVGTGGNEAVAVAAVETDPPLSGGTVDLVQPPPTSSTSASTPQLPAVLAARLKRDDHGLFAAVIQQHDTKEVLMLGWMNDEALARTLAGGLVTFFSRSRQRLWLKGETSGHVQHVKSVALDCDGDAVLIAVDQVDGACHTGDRSCFDAGKLSQ